MEDEGTEAEEDDDEAGEEEHDLAYVSWNVNGLGDDTGGIKKEFVMMFLVALQIAGITPDVLGLQEAKLKEGAEFSIRGYTTFSRLRATGGGGGRRAPSTRWWKVRQWGSAA